MTRKRSTHNSDKGRQYPGNISSQSGTEKTDNADKSSDNLPSQNSTRSNSEKENTKESSELQEIKENNNLTTPKRRGRPKKDKEQGYQSERRKAKEMQNDSVSFSAGDDSLGLSSTQDKGTLNTSNNASPDKKKSKRGKKKNSHETDIVTLFQTQNRAFLKVYHPQARIVILRIR